LVATMNEHVSLFGLKVKVLNRDMEEFPGGYQWNQRSGKYMHAFYKGEVHPIIFHMSWTLNKDNKLLYFRQMGEWYVKDTCIQKKRRQILGLSSPTAHVSEGPVLIEPCCAAEPLISCHFKDKPSIIPCIDSPNIDKGKAPFWK
jgi:hypothetical protein